jgi:hypothetical protein
MADLVFKYKKFDGKLGRGEMRFLDHGIVKPFISGPYGKGFAPKGKYKARYYSDYDRIKQLPSAEAYMQHGLGWFILMEPQFDTDRSGIGIHPDGNIIGSLGCFVLDFMDYQENLYTFNMLRQFIDYNKQIEIEVK